MVGSVQGGQRRRRREGTKISESAGRRTIAVDRDCRDFCATPCYDAACGKEDGPPIRGEAFSNDGLKYSKHVVDHAGYDARQNVVRINLATDQ